MKLLSAESDIKSDINVVDQNVTFCTFSPFRTFNTFRTFCSFLTFCRKTRSGEATLRRVITFVINLRVTQGNPALLNPKINPVLPIIPSQRVSLCNIYQKVTKRRESDETGESEESDETGESDVNQRVTYRCRCTHQGYPPL